MWVRFLYAPLLYLAYFTLLIIAYVSNISAHFTILVLRPCVLYGNKPGNYSGFFSRCRLRRRMRKVSGDTPHPGKGLRPLHSKLGISATQLLILPAPSTAEEIKQVVGCHGIEYIAGS